MGQFRRDCKVKAASGCPCSTPGTPGSRARSRANCAVTASSSTMRTVCGADTHGFHNVSLGARKQVTVVTPGSCCLRRVLWRGRFCARADRAWCPTVFKTSWGPLDLGRFDSYTLRPHPVQFMSHRGDRLRRTCLRTRAASTTVSSGPWHQPCNTSGRLAESEPCPLLRSVMRTETGLRALGPLPAAPPASSPLPKHLPDLLNNASARVLFMSG